MNYIKTMKRERWETERVNKDRQRMTKRKRRQRGGVGTLCVSNGLHHQESRQKGNGMIAPHHPSFSLLPPALFFGHPSDCISSGLFCRPCSPFTTSPTLSETYFCPVGVAPSFITYRMVGVWGLGGGSWIWSGSLMKGGQRGATERGGR